MKLIKGASVLALLGTLLLLGAGPSEATTVPFTPNIDGTVDLDTEIILPSAPGATLGANYDAAANPHPGATGTFIMEVDTVHSFEWNQTIFMAALSTAGSTSYGEGGSDPSSRCRALPTLRSGRWT